MLEFFCHCRQAAAGGYCDESHANRIYLHMRTAAARGMYRAMADSARSPARRGVIFIILSAMAFSVMSVLVKRTSVELPLGEMVFFRGVVTLGLSWLMVKRAGIAPWGTQRKRLMFRGVIGFCGLTCYYAALGHLPLAHATLIQNATPVVTAMLAWWLLRERVTLRVGVAIALGLAGVVLVNLMRGGGASSAAVWPVAVAIIGTFFSATAYVTVRELAKTEDPLVIVFYFPLIATPLALPWALWHWQWPNPVQWLLLAGVGITTQIGQVFLTRGLALLPAGRATAIGYIQAIFAVGWGALLFHEHIHLGIVLGLLLIGCATALVASAKR